MAKRGTGKKQGGDGTASSTPAPAPAKPRKRKQAPTTGIAPPVPERVVTKAGSASWRAGWKHLEEEGRRIAEDLSKDPEQLEPRRLLALQEAVLRQIAIPSPELVEARAFAIATERGKAKLAGLIVSELMATIRSDRTMTTNTRELGRQILIEVESLLGEIEVTDIDREMAERELYSKTADALASLQASQRAAANSVRLDVMFARYMLPYFNEMGGLVRQIIEQHQPSPELRAIAMADLERRVRMLLAEAHQRAKKIEAEA